MVSIYLPKGQPLAKFQAARAEIGNIKSISSRCGKLAQP